MKFNMVCVKFDQKIKKPTFRTFEVFRFFLKPKKLGFFGAIFRPGTSRP